MTPAEVKKARRQLEDELRKAILKLEAKGLLEEAEDLIFRLQRKMAEKMVEYLR
jgi:Ribonuclease G/E